MIPLDRFNLDRDRIQYLADDAYPRKSSLWRRDRKVNKTNLFSIHSQKFECPVDLRQKVIQVRFDRQRQPVTSFTSKGQRMGQATPLDLHSNAHRTRSGDHV